MATHILIWFLVKSFFENSSSLIAPQEVQPNYTQSALVGCTEKEPFGPRRYIVPISVVHIIFS